jgi:histidinol dehydrogenase
MIAGPSEVLVMADGENDPDWIAADLLAQAEHDPVAQSILITDDAGFRRARGRGGGHAVEDAARGRNGRGELARLRRGHRGAGDRRRASPFRSPTGSRPNIWNWPVRTPKTLSMKVRNAGAIFIGRYTPEVIGDYVGGSNHVLPTARSARFSSGLSVLDFVKRTSLLQLGPEQLRALGPAAIALAEAEGLDAHGKSVSIRLNL